MTIKESNKAHTPWYKTWWGLLFIVILVIAFWKGISHSHKREQFVHDKSLPYKSQPDENQLEKHIQRKITPSSTTSPSFSVEIKSIRNCKSAAMKRLDYPRHANFHTILGSKVEGNTLYLDFESKNAFGMEKAYIAVCSFDVFGNIYGVDIVDRKDY